MVNETCCVHPPNCTLEINTERYFGEEKEDQQIPGALKWPATSLGLGGSAVALGGTVSGDNSE